MAENGFRAFQRAKMSHQDTQPNTISCIFLKKKQQVINCKTCLSGRSKRRPKLIFKTDYRLMRVTSLAECSAILSTFIKVTFVIKIVLSIFEWPLKTGFAVLSILYLKRQVVRTSVFAYR